MKGEDAAGARVGVTRIAEVGFHAGGFVKKGQCPGCSGGKEVGEAGRVSSGLIGDGGERGAYLLGFNYAESFAVHEEQVIAGTGLERRLAQRDAASGGWIELLVILNDPAARNELRIDLLAGALLRGFRHEASEGLQ